MRIGLDFDNTIACYDQAIKQLAEELFELPKELPRTKPALRDFLITEGREEEWTVFQGELYGPGMRFAQPFEGAIMTMKVLVDQGHELVIISHRTRWPYAGQRYDLHKAARNWIRKQLQAVEIFGMNTKAIHLMRTKNDKIAKIIELRCQVFVDDLPEILESPMFPKSTLGVLFTSSSEIAPRKGTIKISHWKELSSEVAKLV
jgi:hypothetical protein